ncbi:MAG: hypothetical protein EOP83_13415 [Verrucomicrobiaceae bacterium]|nr:MAG: hypothetical protein EOP83_13415 [Verrucomicrobiaceae bacterium]
MIPSFISGIGIWPSNAAKPIRAWAEMCERVPGECRIDLSQPERITLTKPVWEMIQRVNVQVNRAILPMTDQDHWGLADQWNFAEDGKGDCEDYQLVKRRRLAGAGLPRRAMLMTVVIDETGQGHAVLTIRTNRGDLILDNRTDKVLSWIATGYLFVKREGSTDSRWVALSNEPTTETATK